jgi:nucleoside-triphosphatase THEP1
MDRAGFVQSSEWIRNGTKSESLIIDEIGKFELDGNGYYDVVKHILSSSFPGDLVLVTRNIYVESVMLLFALPESSRIVDVTRRAQ